MQPGQSGTYSLPTPIELEYSVPGGVGESTFAVTEVPPLLLLFQRQFSPVTTVYAPIVAV